MDDLRYPIGRFAHDGPVSDADLAAWLDDLDALPAQLRAAVAGLTDAQLDTTYRPGGWTVRQVVHHVPDSHTNALVRFKWALTEDAPRIKAYDEVGWADLPDTRAVPVETALAFLDALHARWTGLLRALDRAALARTFVHPVSGATALDRTVGMYAWHGRHHVAHITRLAEREGWRA
jgi:hypothetical protein